MRVCLDIECNGLEAPSKIWLIVAKDIDTGKLYIFRNPTDDQEAAEAFRTFAVSVRLWIGHNILGYDLVHIRRLLGVDISVSSVADTLVVSKLVNYSRPGHSIEDYGIEFGFEKIKYYDFSKWSQELEDYCIRDVDINHLVYNKFRGIIDDPKWGPSLQLEHNFQLVVNNLHANGFHFNTSRAEALKGKVEAELAGLDQKILAAFPPKQVLIREFTPKETKHGTISKTSVPRALWGTIHEYEVGQTYRQTKDVPFNPSSHKQIISVLNEAGWSPVDKTQTHIDTEREINHLRYGRMVVDEEVKKGLQDKLKDLAVTGWKASENNLITLPEVEYLELWKDKWRIKIPTEVVSTIKEILKTSDGRRENITIKIQELPKISNSKEIMEYLSKTLNKCYESAVDVVKFVEAEKNSWSIIVTPKATFVDCSASFVTDTWAGMKDTASMQKRILKIVAARTLARRILLEARRRSLKEWIDLCREDSRIHGRFYGIGAWTHRMAHQQPNTANIPNDLDTNGNKKLLGKEMRQLWCAPKNRLLIGVDAEGIQLRIFAHYIDDEEFTNALVSGNKANKTDPHSLNQKILGRVCKTRQAAKRFVFALLLGGGMSKLAQILECPESDAREALDRLLDRYQGFARLKSTTIPADARRGYFIGLDGRAVQLPGDTPGERKHLCMSGYLQNGEAIVVKNWVVKAEPRIKLIDPTAMYVGVIHDEIQTEACNNLETCIKIAKEQAEILTKVGEELKLKCPLAGSYWNDDHKDYTIGTNWYATH